MKSATMVSARRYAAAALLGALMCASAAEPWPAFAQPALGPECQLEAGPTRAVAHVIDGETVRLDDGSEARLIGALAPRAFDVGADGGSWPPEQAAAQALRELVQGRSVTLWFGGRRNDRYGRMLAHLVTDRDGVREWVQGAMLELGMARAYVMPANRACHEALLARERLARDSHRGLWANAAYYIRTARKPDELVPLSDTYQLVHGTIVRARRSRGWIYLDFAARGRSGFSARLSPDADALPPGVHLETLRGRAVLMRGWIEHRTGPSIRIDAEGQLELVDGSGARRSNEPAEHKEAPGEFTAGRR